MPVKTWATNDVPTASDLNTQYRDQVVSTVTSATRPSGTEGQIIYETDTDLCYIYNGGWVRFGASGAWTSYTPTLTQSAAVTKTVTYAKYEKIGRMVSVTVSLSVTGTGTANNAITVTLPFTAASAVYVGSGYMLDSGVLFYPMIVWPGSTTAVSFLDATQGTGAVSMGQTGAVFSAALAAGDLVAFSLTYEAST